MQKFRAMYIRFIAKYFNRQTGREETGIFRAADYVFRGLLSNSRHSLQRNSQNQIIKPNEHRKIKISARSKIAGKI